MAELRDEFWKNLPLEALAADEWEALCDGCGLCCLIKLEDEDTGRLYFTNLTCILLDGDDCQCSDYPNRQSKVPDCRSITLSSLREINWLPPTCAYRLREQGKDLFEWHPLNSGSPASVLERGPSAWGWTLSEAFVDEEDYEDYLVKNPFQIMAHRKKIT